MDNKKQYEKICQHEFAPLGFEKISTDDTKVEVVAAVACIHCATFRTKILYFDRQRGIPDGTPQRDQVKLD